MCECCEVNAAQPCSFLCEECTLRIAIPLASEGEDESMEE